MVNFTILGSGSSGNCAYLETDHSRILIDAGLSGKQIDERLKTVGRSLHDISAVFITHEHSDHVCGLPVLTKRYNIPVYVNRLTAEFLRPQLPTFNGWNLFETGQTVQFGDLAIETFSVPHDAYDPVGFMFHHEEGSIGFLTDLGYATKLIIERVRKARALVLEANHDLQMLHADTRRPWSVKQRILSRHGHLSNDAAAEVAVEITTENLRDLYLGHLSSDCNEPELACNVVRKKLSERGLNHVNLHQTAPDRPCATLQW
jgi:phosphoribosyl 1,2-cyclic phosphodiesterase